jgi:hypothetical protein
MQRKNHQKRTDLYDKVFKEAPVFQDVRPKLLDSPLTLTQKARQASFMSNNAYPVDTYGGGSDFTGYAFKHDVPGLPKRVTLVYDAGKSGKVVLGDQHSRKAQRVIKQGKRNRA